MKGGQCLYLLPEIAIITQIIKYLELYFGDKVLIYHSKLNAKESAGLAAYSKWRGMRSSRCKKYVFCHLKIWS